MFHLETKRNMNKRNIYFALLILLSCLLIGCKKEEITVSSVEIISTGNSTSEEVNNDISIEPEEEIVVEQEAEPDPAVEILEKMTLEEKIWQLLVVTPEQLTKGACSTDTTEVFLDCLKEKPAGGIMYFGKNLVDREQTISMTGNAMDFGYMVEGLPLFLCIDEEGGRVARVGCREQFGVPRIGAMAKIKDENEAFEAGKTIGIYLSELGFNFNLAPDADVLTDPNNEAIGDRSFGTDPKVVSDYAGAFSDGLHESGVISCYKHFPGHGGVTGDTHNGFIATRKTLDELLLSELLPFKEAEEKGVNCIMVAHIAAPNVTGDDTPASLSYELITEVLRNQLGFKGLIITDALNMNAVNDFSQGDAAVMALLAGADLILEPSDIDAAFEGIYEAVKVGRISEERINDSVLRIINVKLSMINKEGE